MLRLVLALLALSLPLIYVPTAAAGTPLACQGEASAGLNWENGMWAVRQFHLPKFILVQEGDTLTKESVAKALEPLLPLPSFTTCHKEVTGQFTCHGESGEFLYFNPKTQRGTIAQTFGGTSTSPNRDNVKVEVFSCIKF